MEVQIDVPRIVQAMKANGWSKTAAAVNCHMNNKTLAEILDGKVPRRLDVLYRLSDGLKIPIQEMLLGSTHKTAQGSRLYVLPGGRRSDSVA
jgi:transcriptional regulator with XRE-family HTH domain